MLLDQEHMIRRLEKSRKVLKTQCLLQGLKTNQLLNCQVLENITKKREVNSLSTLLE